jgi:hypothetical protein
MHRLSLFRHTCPVQHSPATFRSGFLVRTPSNEPRLLIRGMQRLRMRMVCAQCEEQCGQRPYPAAPHSRRASGCRSRPPCQTCRRPSRGPTSLPLKRPARPPGLLNLTKIWQSPANELSQWKLPGLPKPGRKTCETSGSGRVLRCAARCKMGAAACDRRPPPCCVVAVCCMAGKGKDEWKGHLGIS